MIRRLLAGAALVGTAWSVPVMAAPAGASRAVQGKLIPARQFKLANGLTVVFHVDRSDPVVAVSLNAHVGSAREEPGRTGFAHMFEHLFFLDSENVGKGGLDRMSARIGGAGANGSTTRDRTDYFQTVPNDALEKMIWAEADKLGFFINTVTEAVLAKEKQVVKNEKRQSVDNQPYGHLDAILPENLYPANHPYHWSVIGSLADLDAATLTDVRAFYRRWYGPNNVTLVIAGDFDEAQAEGWVRKYFDEIASGPPVAVTTMRPAPLPASRNLFHEDGFAKQPLLAIAWPAPPPMHPDHWPMQLLGQVLTEGREAPLHAVIVDEQKLADAVGASVGGSQMAEEFAINVRAFDGIDLDRVRAGIATGMARFERDGVGAATLKRIKALIETNFYREMGSVNGKAAMLARYRLLAGDATAIDRDLAALQAVTAADVVRVYNAYLKDRPNVAVSMVPKGQPTLALAGATRAQVTEEAVVQGAEAAVDASAAASYARTPSTFDRTVEPAYGPAPRVAVPAIWTKSLANGLKVSGIEDREVPLLRFELAIDGGRLQDRLAMPGVSAMTARMLQRGTARRTPAELENALKELGATVNVEARDEHFVISGTTLARNGRATMDLVAEMLLEPRWDPAELALAKASALAQLKDEQGNPNALAMRANEAISFGDGHIYGRHRLGTEASIAAMSMADLKTWHAAKLAPNIARLRIVGAVDQAGALASSAALASRWPRRSVASPAWPAVAAPTVSSLYFYDVPESKQSTFYFAHPGPRRADPDAYAAQVMNYRLGGGGFASRLTQQVREGKGYTYGIGSGFEGNVRGGEFRLRSGVRANVTLEATVLTRDILRDYGATFTPEDLAVTKSFLTKARARAFETAGAKLNYLGAIGDFGLSPDYPRREQAQVDAMTVQRIRALAAAYVRPQAMRYIIVGDAATQEARLKALGLGEPVRVNALVDRLAK